MSGPPPRPVPLPPLRPFAFLDMHGPHRRVACEVSPWQSIAIVDHEELGRALFLDGALQSAALDEGRYHELLIHPAMKLHGAVRHVLVGGAGEGASLRELCRFPSVEQIVAVDIDARLVELVREHLGDWHAGAFDDPRVELRIESVVDTVARSPDAAFDLAVLDLTDPEEDEADMAFLDETFFADLRRVLRPDGVVAMQFGELHPDVEEERRAREARLKAIFPRVEVLGIELASLRTRWGVALATAVER